MRDVGYQYLLTEWGGGLTCLNRVHAKVRIASEVASLGDLESYFHDASPAIRILSRLKLESGNLETGCTYHILASDIRQ